MQRSVLLILAVCGLLMTPVLSAQDAVEGTFEAVKMKTFDRNKFLFPADMRGERLNIVFLGMAGNQEGGEMQTAQLLEWQAALEAEQVFSENVMAYQFSAMNSPPFFLKRIIANAISESYEGKVPKSQSGVMYLDDLQEFATAAGLVADEQSTIVIADAQGKPMQVFKGALSDEGFVELVLAIRAASGESQVVVDVVSDTNTEITIETETTAVPVD